MPFSLEYQCAVNRTIIDAGVHSPGAPVLSEAELVEMKAAYAAGEAPESFGTRIAARRYDCTTEGCSIGDCPNCRYVRAQAVELRAAMERVKAAAALPVCALCHEAIEPRQEATTFRRKLRDPDQPVHSSCAMNDIVQSFKIAAAYGSHGLRAAGR
jgi:hypothetical protein